MIRALLLLLLPVAAEADTIRVATFNTELSRDGPGLLLRDIQRGDPQVQAVTDVLAAAQPDILTLQGLDWDLNGEMLSALVDTFAEAGLDYPYRFAAKPNAGVASEYDLDGDERLGGPGDAQGWGMFTGQNSLAVLSKFEIAEAEIQDFTDLLWRNLPEAELPQVNGAPFPSAQAQSVQRLSSTSHWVIPLNTPMGRLDLMTFHASPPVFDGPEDRNGLRNHDEIRVWSKLLNGDLGQAPPGAFVIAGDFNLDPVRGEGRKAAIHQLIDNPDIQDPQPRTDQGDLTTVYWKGVGAMRVDYVLPSSHLRVVSSGVIWPAEGTPLRDSAERASRHRLVWVDVAPQSR